MKTQGEAIRHVVASLTSFSWTVVYFSMPNTAHAGVVPIPTLSGGAKQRYPDVVATKADRLLLVEVEPRLSSAVEAEILRRFRHHDEALSDQSIWQSWSSRVQEITGVHLPARFDPFHQLVICRPVEPRREGTYEMVSANDYQPPTL